jgi:hypothetical protein
VAEEVVGKGLLGGTELTAGWGNDRSGLPPARCSQRKTATGKSCGLTSQAGSVGRLLVQEGHRDEALLLVWSDSSGGSSVMGNGG